MNLYKFTNGNIIVYGYMCREIGITYIYIDR